jgi:hypothetical protein
MRRRSTPLPKARPQRRDAATTMLPPSKHRTFEPVDLAPRQSLCCALCRAAVVLVAETPADLPKAVSDAGWRLHKGRAYCSRCSHRPTARRPGQPRGRTAP